MKNRTKNRREQKKENMERGRTQLLSKLYNYHDIYSRKYHDIYSRKDKKERQVRREKKKERNQGTEYETSYPDPGK